ncbi:MAG: hypothetical protein ACLQPV_07640 [Vulcanimicrobiaceae bacterium]
MANANDAVLMLEVEARRILQGRVARITVLAPYGNWLGFGALRVLRADAAGDDANGPVELLVGYESYRRMERAS